MAIFFTILNQPESMSDNIENIPQIEYYKIKLEATNKCSVKRSEVYEHYSYNYGTYKRWYNIDLPETIEIRKRFLTENGPVYQIAKSAMDISYTDDIEYNKENVLVIIEGLSMYLHENDIRQIFSIIEKAFNKSTVMIETMSPFFVKHMKEKSIEGSNAKFSWGVKNGKELQQIVPAFNWKRDVSLVEGMKVIMPVYNVLGIIPAVRGMSNKIVVMER